MAGKRSGSILDNNAMVSEPREPRRTPFSYILFSLFVTILGITVAVGAALLYGQKRFEAAGPLTIKKTAVIKSGEGGAKIAATLAKQGIISNERIFYVASVIYQKLGLTLKAGEYSFEPGDSMQAVFDRISKGKGLSYKITVPEGFTSLQALQRIRENPVLTGDLPKALAEGVLLPDTYAFQRGDSRQSVIDRMRKAQTKLFDKLWSQRQPDLPFNSIEEAIILASIVEKETGVASERARVASVFVNRLKRNMRLQSDPTIIYGIVGGKGKLGRPIRRSEIDAKTAYNTYQIDGLPPTPIANPGKQAMIAVLRPAASDDLYFVADGTGGHAFAGTLAEHQVNVQRYRKIERAERAAAAAIGSVDVQPAAPEPAKPEAATAQAAQPAADKPKEPDQEPGSQELPVTGNAQAATTAKIPLPRPRPVIN